MILNFDLCIFSPYCHLHVCKKEFYQKNAEYHLNSAPYEEQSTMGETQSANSAYQSPCQQEHDALALSDRVDIRYC